MNSKLIKQDKCLNCGASIDYRKIKDRTYQCPYCREHYHIDEYGIIEEYKVKIKYMGKTIWCYLECTEFRPNYSDEMYITSTGKTYIRQFEPTLRFNLVSYKIEEGDNNG